MNPVKDIFKLQKWLQKKQKDSVIILLDSIKTLDRAYNFTTPSNSIVLLSGVIDSNAYKGILVIYGPSVQIKVQL